MSNWTDDRFVVLATFKVGPENKAAFLEAAKDDALQSLANESGCLQFDVVCLEGDTVLFCKAYSDKAAFDHHLEIAHFRRFQAAATDGHRGTSGSLRPKDGFHGRQLARLKGLFVAEMNSPHTLLRGIKPSRLPQSTSVFSQAKAL